MCMRIDLGCANVSFRCGFGRTWHGLRKKINLAQISVSQIHTLLWDQLLNWAICYFLLFIFNRFFVVVPGSLAYKVLPGGAFIFSEWEHHWWTKAGLRLASLWVICMHEDLGFPPVILVLSVDGYSTVPALRGLGSSSFKDNTVLTSEIIKPNEKLGGVGDICLS